MEERNNDREEAEELKNEAEENKNSIEVEEYENIMVCPYFLNNLNCNAGENCEYAHCMTKILPKDVMCEFYERGVCKYGKKCFFSHGNKKKRESDNPKNIKMRFSFMHKGIQEKRNLKMQANFSKLAIAKCFPEITKFGSSRNDNSKKLPMERCIYYDIGDCPLKDWCPCLHGKFCDLCQKYCLDPNDKNQHIEHIEECEKELMRDMELSFALQCSRDKVCGICLEVIFDKEKLTNRRFGILENCNHVFCLECIKRWRRRGGVMYQEMVIDSQVQRKCPQCRIHSDFIIPSNFWFFTDKEKVTLMERYKSNLKTRNCKYFNKGEGTCPFGGSCFYLHALPDGTVVELPPPAHRDFLRRRDMQRVEELLFWEYLEQNEEGWQIFIDDRNDVFVL